MTVYIEYVIADNFFFTMLICYLSYKILREKVRIIRCIAASTVGTICAVLYPFVKSALLVIAFKIALYIIMCLILYLKLPKFFIRAVMFLIATAVVGGVQFMIGFAVFKNASDALRYPISDLPLSFYFVPPLALFLIAKGLLSSLNAHRLRQNYIYDMNLTVEGKTLKLRGLVDTGNGVKDVVFINMATALELLGGKFFNLYEKKEGKSTVIGTATGSQKIMLLPGKIELYFAEDEHIFMDVQVGISNLKTNGEYEAVLPLSILEKEKSL